jgi:hypothetical protein
MNTDREEIVMNLTMITPDRIQQIEHEVSVRSQLGKTRVTPKPITVCLPVRLQKNMKPGTRLCELRPLSGVPCTVDYHGEQIIKGQLKHVYTYIPLER